LNQSGIVSEGTQKAVAALANHTTNVTALVVVIHMHGRLAKTNGAQSILRRLQNLYVCRRHPILLAKVVVPATPVEAPDGFPIETVMTRFTAAASPGP
jgi:hypothetical protein